MGELSDLDRRIITERVRRLVQKHLEMGVSMGTKVICHNCGHTKSVVGAVSYGRYRLCNDCALQYEIAKAKGNIQTIEDFVLAD